MTTALNIKPFLSFICSIPGFMRDIMHSSADVGLSRHDWSNTTDLPPPLHTRLTFKEDQIRCHKINFI